MDNIQTIIDNKKELAINTIKSTANSFYIKQIDTLTESTINFISNSIKKHCYAKTAIYTGLSSRKNLITAIKRMCPTANIKDADVEQTIIARIKNTNTIAIIEIPDKNIADRFVIKIYGTHATSLLSKFNRTYKKYINQQSTNIDINTLYKNTATQSWDATFKNISTKSINEIFTDVDTTSLITNLKQWEETKDYFEKLNLTHKTGILLYGEPGTGKTTFAKAIAKELSSPVYIINMSDFEEKQIEHIKDDIEESYDDKTCILIFEDIDCIFSTRDNLQTEKQKHAAQLLLQFLDGIFSIPNIISIATTNHIESLDPALIRDGRFDYKIEMSNISRETSVKMCKYFEVNPNHIPDLLENESFPINPSYLQTKIIKHLLEQFQGEYHVSA